MMFLAGLMAPMVSMMQRENQGAGRAG